MNKDQVVVERDIITDVGVLTKKEVVDSMTRIMELIDKDEYFAARGELSPMLAKVKCIRDFASSVPLTRSMRELLTLTMLHDSFTYLLSAIDHQILCDEDRAERMRRLGL